MQLRTFSPKRGLLPEKLRGQCVKGNNTNKVTDIWNKSFSSRLCVAATVRSGPSQWGLGHPGGPPSVCGDVTHQLAAQEGTLCAHAGKMLDK